MAGIAARLLAGGRWGWGVYLALGLVIGGLYLAGELARGTGPGFPLDDPWIHAQFARNLATGGGFALNAGEPVSGSTSPLWTLLLAVVQLATTDPRSVALAAKVAGSLLLGASGLLGARLLRGWGASPVAAAAGGIALVGLAPLGWGAVSGLEVSLYVTLSLGALLAGQDLTPLRRRLGAGLLFALAVYARPECLALFGLYLLDRTLFTRTRKGWSQLVQVTGVFLAGLTPYAVLNYSLSGLLVPHTFRVKVAGEGLAGVLAQGDVPGLLRLLVQSGPAYLGDCLGHWHRANPLLPWGVLVATLVVLPRLYRGPRRTLLPFLIVAGYAYLLGVAAPFRGAAFQEGRYIANATAIGALVAVWGWSAGLAWIHRRSESLAVACGALVLLAGLFNLVTAERAMIRNHARSVASIEGVQVRIGDWLAQNTAPGATVATNDIGAIAYFSHRKVIDLAGLANPEVVPYLREFGTMDPAARVYLREVRPDYLAIFPRWFPQLIMSTRHEFRTRVDLMENTAGEWTFFPEAETLAGLLLLDVRIKANPTTMIVLEPDWDAPPVPLPE